MPVKVRCPNCEKLLNAPDTARGKAVKCPACQTRISVPANDQDESIQRVLGKTGAKKKVGQDTIDFLVNTDLTNAADSSASMCPKCGADIPEDATECPACGVDPSTGQLSMAARKRVGRRGPDPAEFYSVAWKDAWAFTKENARVGFRITAYLMTFSLLSGLCQFMVGWCTGLPPRMFWTGFGIVANLVMPGLVWAITVYVIQTSISKKKSNIKDVNFDLFQNAALGIKTILWSLVFWVWFPPAILMYPLAMIHMSMPVTNKGWFWPRLVPVFFQHIGAILFWWGTLIVTNLILIIGWVVFFFAGSTALMQAIASTQALDGEGNRVALGATAITIFVLFGLGAIASVIYNSFALLFNARVMGLLAYYFRDTLELDVLVPEKTYVRKEVQYDAFGVKIKTKADKQRDIVIAIIAIIIIPIVGYYIYVRATGGATFTPPTDPNLPP